MRRTYFLRLATVALALVVFVVVLNALLLVPTYLYAQGEVERERAELAAADASAQSSEETEVRTRTALLGTTASYLTRIESATAATAALRAVLAVPHEGIALRGFIFTAPKAADAKARMDVNGVAASRDALRRYAAALAALPFVDDAELPISAYAKEREISFTITLTGSLKP